LIGPLVLCCVSSVVAAQGSREELKRSAQVVPAQPKTTPRAASEPASPESRTGALQPTDASLPREPLTSALATCDAGSESAEPLALHGARGEIRLDSCYRGRDQLVCGLNVLLREAKELIENYGKIVDSHYPDVTHVKAICDMKSNDLSVDLQRAQD